jgi:hypothetical protein
MIEMVGNGLTYNREATAPSAAFFDVGDTWTESTPTFTQFTVTLKIMGGDADTDNFLLATLASNTPVDAVRRQCQRPVHVDDAEQLHLREVAVRPAC